MNIDSHLSDLCKRCRHRRDRDLTSIEQMRRMRTPSPEAQSAAEARRAELMIDLRNEQIRFEQERPVTLRRRPIKNDWCSARSTPREGEYYFCAWLTETWCDLLQCETTIPGCSRCSTGTGACSREPERDFQPVATAARQDQTAHPARSGAASSVNPENPDLSISLGSAFDLAAVPKPLKSSMGRGSFQLDHELVPAGYDVAITDGGLAQTYMLFGGPGSGKTTLFRHLLIGLLGQRDRPGCLLLDPKGVLTEWLERVMAFHHRSEDLTVLSAGAGQSFNVLGATATDGQPGLAPRELGRLVSEVVLAGATIDPSWAPLVGDLMESSAVVLSAHIPGGQLAADTWLRQILTTEVNYYKGQKRLDVPIVVTARRVRNHPDPDVQMASLRIEEFYQTVEDRQRRYLRQVIERSLGELMSDDWRRLSRSGTSAGYSGIIRAGQVLAVSVGQGSPAFQGALSTLTKAVFQQAVLADLAVDPDEQRFCILACDEYAQAITEGESGMVSDSRFFSLSREAGCLNLLALQSVATGRSRFPATMKDRWDAILGNVTVKFFFRLNDVETAELGSRLSGTQRSYVPVSSTAIGPTGTSLNEGGSLIEHPVVPPWYLTNRLARGCAFVHGSLDGESSPISCFIETPYPLAVPEHPERPALRKNRQ